jgi:hypothetical protein
MRFAHSAVALPLAGLAILLSACNDPAKPAANQSAPVTEIPASLSGELTSQSAVNLNDGSRNQSFELKLLADTLYRITTSGALQQPSLLLLTEDNRPVGGPRAEQLYMQPEQDGVYRLAVSGQSASEFGPFRIEVSTAEATNEGELQSGADILGRLQGSGTGKGNRYTFQVADKGLYEIILRSSEFDTVLKLRGNGVSLTDDDSAGGTDSRLLATLDAGNYQLTAAGIDSGDEGIYSLGIKPWELPEGIDLIEGAQLELDREYTGMLVSQNQTYSLVVEQAGLLQLSMRSDELDSVLELSGSGVNAQDDDSGGGQNALISTPVQPGTYRVKASQYGNGEGMFTLQADITEVAALSRSIAPGESRVGRLNAGTPTRTQLQISEAGHYQITLRSSEFDAMLSLEGQGLNEQDDDSGGGINAQLNLHLDAGEYQLSNGSYGDQGTGSFVLSVSAAQ